MAVINAQSVEDFSDRIIYRFPAGRYEQALSNFADTISSGYKTLVNTETSRRYNIPQSGISARFYKINLLFSAVLIGVGPGAYTSIMARAGFFRINAPSLTFDGKSMQTEFYEPKNEIMYGAAQLRAIDITDIQMEPSLATTDFQGTALSTFNFGAGSLDSRLAVLMQIIVTYYKK